MRIKKAGLCKGQYISGVSICNKKLIKLKKSRMKNYDNFTGCFRAICNLRRYLTI